VLAVRRTLASLGAWTLGAGVAVGVGVLALSLIDSGLALGAGQPLPDPVAAPRVVDSPAPAPASPAPADPAPASRAAAPSATDGPSRQLSSTGGTVLARCTGTAAYLISWSPAPGYQADDVKRGPAPTVVATFRTGPHRVVFAVHCVGGVPQRAPWHDDDGTGE
jgi:hypothetical protein